MIQAGFTFSARDGQSAKLGAGGQYYLARQEDLGRFITKHLHIKPERIAAAGMADFRGANKQSAGIVRFSIDFSTSTATGHIGLFRNGNFREPRFDDYTVASKVYTTRYMEYWRMW